MSVPSARPHAATRRLTALSGRPLRLALYLLVGLVYVTFCISTVPGVRPETGYNLLLDGWLNNIAYMLSPLLCLVRARRASSFRRSWVSSELGLTLYGLGNVYWTIFIRPLDPEPFPSFADGLWLSFYGFAFVALLLVVREMAERLPTQPVARRHRRRPGRRGGHGGGRGPGPRRDRWQCCRRRHDAGLPPAGRRCSC